MVLKRVGFTFLFLITFTLVFSYLSINDKPVYAQVFEFQEDDYFDVDGENTGSSTNTNEDASILKYK